MARTFIATILTLIFSSCQSLDEKLFKFNNEDLKHIESYRPGDTLLFENEQKQVNSFQITNFETEERGKIQRLISPKPESDYWLNIRQLNKENGSSLTKQKIIKDTTTNKNALVVITKYPPKNTVYYRFSFKNFYTQGDSIFGIFHSDTIKINTRMFTNYYEINHGFPERVIEPFDIETIFWTDKEGLIAYKLKNGIYWTKKSSR